MEFKVGDKIRRIENCRDNTWNGKCDSQNIENDIILILKDIYNGGESIYLEEVDGGWDIDKFELVEKTNSEISNKKMTKKLVYNVLVVNKKTGKVEKDETVVADGERHAILKAYDIDVEKLSFTVTQRAEFEEDKPQTVVLENKPK